MVPKKITEPFSVKNNLKKDFLFLYCEGVCEFVSSIIFICYFILYLPCFSFPPGSCHTPQQRAFECIVSYGVNSLLKRSGVYINV